MKRGLSGLRWGFFLVIFLLSGTIVSCQAELGSRLEVWLDSPRGGVRVPVGEPVEVISHAYASEGLAEIVLYVNGVAYSSIAPGERGADLSEFRHEWVPTETGEYTLQLWVYDLLGEIGGPATVVVYVGEIVYTSTPTLVITATDTATPTPVNTDTPTPTPTLPPNPPTPTFTSSPTAYVDTTAPSPPIPVVPANGLVLSCRAAQVLNWQPVQDPSGINGYYVELQYESTPGNWVTDDSWGPLADKQVEVPVNCGGIYRWRVRVQDGAGNMSIWSDYFYFSVDLT